MVPKMSPAQQSRNTVNLNYFRLRNMDCGASDRSTIVVGRTGTGIPVPGTKGWVWLSQSELDMVRQGEQRFFHYMWKPIHEAPP